ncbi:MAG: SCO family protein [Acidimicrobiales bacterium]
MTHSHFRGGARTPGAPRRPHRARRGRKALAAIGLVAFAGGGLAACGGGAPTAPPASMGVVVDRPVPSTPLVTQQGRPTSLAAYRGRYVLMAPFLTLCQEECPMTTGALLAMKHDVQVAGLARKVVFLEVTVDPWRDSPARLAAYAQRFGVTWPLLTGSLTDLTAFWKYFGIYFAKVPEATPPATDWWTGKPLTFDVAHSDGFILIDPAGRERFITVEPPNLHGRLEPGLRHLLDRTGIHNLDHQTPTSWNLPQGLAALSWLVGVNIPSVAST